MSRLVCRFDDEGDDAAHCRVARVRGAENLLEEVCGRSFRSRVDEDDGKGRRGSPRFTEHGDPFLRQCLEPSRDKVRARNRRAVRCSSCLHKGSGGNGGSSQSSKSVFSVDSSALGGTLRKTTGRVRGRVLDGAASSAGIDLKPRARVCKVHPRWKALNLGIREIQESFRIKKMNVGKT